MRCILTIIVFLLFAGAVLGIAVAIHVSPSANPNITHQKHTQPLQPLPETEPQTRNHGNEVPPGPSGQQDFNFIPLPQNVRVENRSQTVEFCGVPYIADKIVWIDTTNVIARLAKFASEHPRISTCKDFNLGNRGGTLTITTDGCLNFHGFLCLRLDEQEFAIDPNTLKVLVASISGGDYYGTLERE